MWSWDVSHATEKARGLFWPWGFWLKTKPFQRSVLQSVTTGCDLAKGVSRPNSPWRQSAAGEIQTWVKDLHASQDIGGIRPSRSTNNQGLVVGLCTDLRRERRILGHRLLGSGGGIAVLHRPQPVLGIGKARRLGLSLVGRQRRVREGWEARPSSWWWNLRDPSLTGFWGCAWGRERIRHPDTSPFVREGPKGPLIPCPPRPTGQFIVGPWAHGLSLRRFESALSPHRG